MRQRFIRYAAAGSALAFLVLSQQPAAAAPASADAVSIAPIPTEAFARPPQVAYAALSPNGKWFAAILNRGDNTVAVVRSVDGEASHTSAKVLMQSDDRATRLAWLHWVSDERLVVSLHFPAKRGSTETTETRLVAIDRDGEKSLTLVEPTVFVDGRLGQLQDQVVDWLPGDGHHILLQASLERGNVSPAVFRVDVDSGRREAVHGRSFGVRHWLADATHRIRVGLRQQGAQAEVIFCDPDGEHWRTAWAFDLYDRAAMQPLGFGTDPNLLYVNADHDGRRAIYQVDLRDPALSKRLLLSDAEQDINGRLLRDPVSGQAIGVSGVRHGDAAANLWDASAQALARSIDQALPGRLNRLLDFDSDGAHYLVYSSGNGQPGQYLIGDRAQQSMSVLARQYLELPAVAMLKKTLFTVTARDGLKLPVHLTLPAKASSASATAVGAPLPTVVLPQGSPPGIGSSDFDPLAEFLANRGYAVLQVTFRGSGNAHSALLQAGLQRQGLEMQDDLTDALQWAVKRGTADAARVCIVGASYGGYAALMGGARTPELYRCVASFAGVSDLLAMANQRAQYVNGFDVFEREVGAFWADRQRLKDTSPRRLAAQFQVPVLLLHGSADRSVPFAQSQAMADALAAAGKPVQLLRLEGGDHTLSYAGHRLQVYQALEKFLAQNLSSGTSPVPAAPVPQPVAELAPADRPAVQ